MAMVDVDDSSLQGGLTAQVRWLGLRDGGRLAVFYIHQMNRVNSRNDLVVTMTAL